MSLDWFHHHTAKKSIKTVPSGCRYALYFDPLTDFEPIAGSAFDVIESLGDGLVALKTADGQYLSQNPNERGSFALSAERKAYETFGLQGSIVTSWTRPEHGDALYSYVIARVPNAA